MTVSVRKPHIAKGYSKAGVFKTAQGKTTLSPKDPLENIEAIISLLPISNSIELNSALDAYIKVLLRHWWAF